MKTFAQIDQLPIRKKKYDMQPAFVKFAYAGGCCMEFKSGRGYSHCHSSGGSETPENFFKPSHWWAHDYRQVHVKSVFEGVPYLDIRHMDGTAALIEASIRGPMIDVDLPPGTISRFSKGSVSIPLAEGVQNEFTALLALAMAEEPSEKPGSLDFVSTDIYLAFWKRAGAIVGFIRKGEFVPA